MTGLVRASLARGIQLAKCAVLLMLPFAWSAEANPAFCESAAQTASRESGVPLDIMRAISIIETGRSQGGQVEPWPWTVNDGSEGHWFMTREEALDHARGLTSVGRQSFDVGCFQLNYRWHGSGFRTLDLMFDPVENARYAAKFLAQLYQETGNWAIAAGRYHSRTETFAQRYRDRFTQIVGSLPKPSQRDTRPVRGNTYQLLQGGRPGAKGSIVPQTESRNALLLTARLSILGGSTR